jgi:hypothetical protein
LLSRYCTVTSMSVTMDGVWIGNGIYCILIYTVRKY